MRIDFPHAVTESSPATPSEESVEMESRLVSAFEIFVHDDRYSVPTLHLVPAAYESAARRLAEVLLLTSSHHLGVELWRDGEQLLALGVCADRRRSANGSDPLRLASAG
ncbi:MAG: hypothetical protein JWP50_1383 [Phenylobacterium sp.]|nr:hypothetical protein [Phenylobacterium sp.]